MRLVNLSIHFDPGSRAAIDLRADVTAGQPVGDHTAPVSLPDATPLDGEQVSPWLLNRLNGLPPVEHPINPGIPGAKHHLGQPEVHP